jgi:hypothetical protein
VTAPLPVAAAAEPQKIPVAGVAEKKAVKAA